jgi:hypothetical protein
LNTLMAGPVCAGDDLWHGRRSGRHVYAVVHGDQAIDNPPLGIAIPPSCGVPKVTLLLAAVEFSAEVIEEAERRRR